MIYIYLQETPVRLKSSLCKCLSLDGTIFKEPEPSEQQLSVSSSHLHSCHNCEQVEGGWERRWEEGAIGDKVGVEQSGKSWTEPSDGREVQPSLTRHQSSWLEGHTLTAATHHALVASISIPSPIKLISAPGVLPVSAGRPLPPAEPGPLLTDTKQYVSGPTLCASCWRCGDQADRCRVRQPT